MGWRQVRKAIRGVDEACPVRGEGRQVDMLMTLGAMFVSIGTLNSGAFAIRSHAIDAIETSGKIAHVESSGLEQTAAVGGHDGLSCLDRLDCVRASLVATQTAPLGSLMLVTDHGYYKMVAFGPWIYAMRCPEGAGRCAYSTCTASNWSGESLPALYKSCEASGITKWRRTTGSWG